MGSHTRTMSLYCFFVLFGSLHIILAADSEKSVTKCTDQLSGKTYPVGSEWKNPGQCTKSICKSEGGGVTIQTKGCPTLQTQSDCKIVKNSKKPYPRCCPKQKCGGKNKKRNGKSKKKNKKKWRKQTKKSKGRGKPKGSDSARAKNNKKKREQKEKEKRKKKKILWLSTWGRTMPELPEVTTYSRKILWVRTTPR